MKPEPFECEVETCLMNVTLFENGKCPQSCPLVKLSEENVELWKNINSLRAKGRNDRRLLEEQLDTLKKEVEKLKKL